MKYYFTFGFNHVHKNCYHVIDAKGRSEAREKMFERFGKKWAFQYSEEQWTLGYEKTQAEHYNLKEIK